MRLAEELCKIIHVDTLNLHLLEAYNFSLFLVSLDFGISVGSSYLIIQSNGSRPVIFLLELSLSTKVNVPIAVRI